MRLWPEIAQTRLFERVLKELSVKRILSRATFVLAVGLCMSLAHADSSRDTIALFKHAGQSAAFFDKSYGYAVFPTVGKAGYVVGGAYGRGRVYSQGDYIGTVAMTQVSVGLQAGAKGYSEIVFFEDKRALDEFTAGSFEFDAGASVVAITAGASASAGTAGVSESASGGKKDASTAGAYRKGVAVFTIVKGGLMYDASIAGQKFSYTARRPG
jgi:lipid-binding SYLF domain-containing protein